MIVLKSGLQDCSDLGNPFVRVNGLRLEDLWFVFLIAVLGFHYFRYPVSKWMKRHIAFIKFPPLLIKPTCFFPIGIVPANGLCELFKPCNLGIDPRRILG